MKLVIYRLGQKVFDERYTSRSLAMVLRQWRGVFEGQGVVYRHSDVSLEINMSKRSNRIFLKMPMQEVELILFLPLELGEQQAYQLFGIYRLFFKNSRLHSI
jgi:hypothetical protein